MLQIWVEWAQNGIFDEIFDENKETPKLELKFEPKKKESKSSRNPLQSQQITIIKNFLIFFGKDGQKWGKIREKWTKTTEIRQVFTNLDISSKRTIFKKLLLITYSTLYGFSIVITHNFLHQIYSSAEIH